MASSSKCPPKAHIWFIKNLFIIKFSLLVGNKMETCNGEKGKKDEKRRKTIVEVAGEISMKCMFPSKFLKIFQDWAKNLNALSFSDTWESVFYATWKLSRAHIVWLQRLQSCFIIFCKNSGKLSMLYLIPIFIIIQAQTTILLWSSIISCTHFSLWSMKGFIRKNFS